MKYLFSIFVLLVSALPAHGQFSKIVFFGDSLSDVGNLHSSTLGLQPGSKYFDGRFSNGPVYSERLADKLGLGPLKATSDDGTNYAYGGARTTGTTFFEGGFLIDDLDEQIDDFLSDQQTAPNDLYVVFAGSNDFILGDATNGAGRANRVLNEMNRLIAAGAKNLLSINLPLLGESPDGRNNQTVLNAVTTAFNETLANGLDQIVAPDVQLFRLNFADLFSVVLENPTVYGFTNTTDQGISADNAEGFLFWDGNHPTTQAHAFVAEAAFRQVQSIPAFGGDFNLDGEISPVDVDLLGRQIVANTGRLFFDVDQDELLGNSDIELLLSQANKINADTDFSGVVDFTDFLVLSRNFGRTDDELRWSTGDFDASGAVEFFDFLTLSRNFGAQPAVLAVPEPLAGHMVWLGGLIVTTMRRRRICARRDRWTGRVSHPRRWRYLAR